MNSKLVIVCIAYNHEKYIEQALKSFVMQKTNFPFEVYIADDCSTDKTSEIIRKYANEHPNIIKPTIREHNVGVWQNLIELLDQVKSEYVALCEGDDYWIDEHKLQKQVDFLDSNKEFSIAFHPVIVKWEDKKQVDDVFPTPLYRFNKIQLTLTDLLKHNFIQTNSVVYRWRFIDDNIYDFLPKDIIPIDYLIHLLHAQKGNIFFQDELMAVYRRHDQGIWTGAGKSDDWFNKNTFKHINFYLALEKQFDVDNRSRIINLVERALFTFCNTENFDYINKLKNQYPNIYNDVLIKLIKYDSINLKLKMKLILYKVVGCFNDKISRKYIKLVLKVDNSRFILNKIKEKGL